MVQERYNWKEMTMHGQLFFFHLQASRTLYNVYNIVQCQMHIIYKYNTFTGNPLLS